MATVEIQVKPRSKNDRVSKGADGTFAVAVTSPPHEGEANKHVVKMMAKVLGVRRSAVAIIRGTTSRRKVLAVEGLERATILTRLHQACKPKG